MSFNDNYSGTGTGSSPISGIASSAQSGIADFMNSNSLVAKISFLLLVIFVFVILLQFCISIMGWFFGPTDSPHLINGMVDAKQMIIITQDPNISGSKTISRSVNAKDGIEFSWSVWLFIDDLTYGSGKYRHIFHKGNDTIDSNGLNTPNNAPGLYISPNTNQLVVMMNTFTNDTSTSGSSGGIVEEIDIPDIPLNKWVNVIIRCKNTTIDIYINGTITKSTTMIGVPKQNYGNVYVAMNGGFSGYISNLWYYNHALGTMAIQNLVKKGPNIKMTGSNAMTMKNPNYLSLRWYFYGNNDGYNP
jgi:hypothetical protein